MFRKIYNLFSKLGGKVAHNRVGESTEVKNENLEEQTMFDDLPGELLELILKRLTLDNNIRASAVCKRWHSVATSVRVLNYLPWLMFCPIDGDQYEFYNPLNHKSYFIELPELSDSQICYSKYGWLLLYQPKTKQLSFFDPFTRHTIQLPRFDQTCYLAAFSCAPTSSDCVVFIVSNVCPAAVTICTCCPGAIEWTIVNYQNQLPLSFGRIIWNTVVFCNGRFYCFGFDNLLAMFDTARRTWTVLLVPLPNGQRLRTRDVFYMTEQEGEIIKVGHLRSEKPSVFKLDQTLMQWKVMSTLDGGTLFAGFMSSSSRTGLPPRMRNRVYFPVNEKQCRSVISFSLNDSRVNPNIEPRGHFDDIIWIEPPKNLSW